MPIDPLYLFVFAGLFSPGPNVILLTTSGARFGFCATIPHVFGVALGVGIIAGLTGLGIGAVLLAFPQIAFILKIGAAIWILYMAYRLVLASSKPVSEGKDRPFTIVEAVLFQWVNPKIWAVALVATSGYSIGLSPQHEAFRLALAFTGINVFVCLFWSFAGSLLAYLFNSPGAWAIFLRVMAAMLALSALMIFL